ncbi:MAG: hypothetical protein ACF8SC_10025 [Phycisphaerales bacterium JB037]
MNLSKFFEHWRIAENPFRGEEARRDDVFARLCRVTGPDEQPTVHSDFEKVLGDLSHPSSAIVFGEKGSGKTAMRLQIADAVAAHNLRRPEERVLLISYDDLNRVLGRFAQVVGGENPGETLGEIAVTDHLDAVISSAVTSLVDALLGVPEEGARAFGPTDELVRDARRLETGLRRDLLLLQTVYDAGERAHERTERLRRLLRIGLPRARVLWSVAAFGGWVLPAMVIAAFLTIGGQQGGTGWTVAFTIALLLWGAAGLKRFGVDSARATRLGRKLRRSLRMIDRTEESWARSLDQVDALDKSPESLPIGPGDETRYAMLGRLRRVVRGFGFRGMIVVVDRVDEPSLINGDPERMRAVVWPMLNNKFLQQEGLGVKMLLPLELRHLLFRESSAFFQEARLDKQSMIERLVWTGPTLYDLCNARLNACLKEGREPLSLLELFAEDVTRQDVVDALDQMHQPRDAFKFLYRCLTEHCASVTADEGSWRIPRLILDTVRRQEVDRLQQLYRGIRPA